MRTRTAVSWPSGLCVSQKSPASRTTVPAAARRHSYRGSRESGRAGPACRALSRPLAALDPAVAENGELIRDIMREQAVDAHLRALRAEAAAGKRRIDVA